MRPELLTRLVTQHPRSVCVVFLVLAALCGATTKFRVGHSYLDWIDTNGAPYSRYHDLVRYFGDAETLMAVFDLAALDERTIAGYFSLLQNVRALDGVLGVYEPAGMLLGATEDYPPEAVDVEILRDAMQLKAPDFRSTIISRDARTAGVLVLVDQSRSDTQALVLKTMREGFAGLGIDVDFGGTVYFSETLKQSIATDMALVNTLLITAAIALLVYFFHSVLLAVCVALGIGLAVLYALAACMALGLTINLLTLLLMPLVFCVGLTTAVHLYSRRCEGRWDYADAIARIFKPALIAALTTAVGCAAFAFAPQPVIARMGLVLPLGVVFAFITMLVFVPALFHWLGGESRLRPPRHGSPRPGGRTSRRVTFALIALTVVSAALLSRISINPDAIFFFDPDTPVIRSYDRIERDLSGLLVADLVIRSDSDAKLTTPETSAQILDIVRQLREIPELTAAVTGFGLQRLQRLGGPGTLLGTRFFTPDERTTRITLRLQNLGGRPYADIAAHIAEVWSRADTAGLTYELTGIIPLILEAQDRLLAIQSVMLPVVVVAICVVLFAVFRSPRVLALALAANLVPLALMAGVMAAFDIPINSINLFVSSVMIGVIVDDTVHLLHAWHTTGSMERALGEVGDAIWVTSVIVCLAFASLLSSNLIPIREFGVLSIVAVASAWLCDVCLLPTLAARSEAPA